MIYAQLNEYGNIAMCTNIPFPDAHVIESLEGYQTLYFDGEALVPRIEIDVVSEKNTYVIGRDETVVLFGLPDDAIVLLEGQPTTLPIPVDTPRFTQVDVVGKYRLPAPITIEFSSPSQALEELKVERTKLLSATDWTVLPDAPLSEEQVISWRSYRQALRDITSSQPEADLSTVIWPTKPY